MKTPLDNTGRGVHLSGHFASQNYFEGQPSVKQGTCNVHVHVHTEACNFVETTIGIVVWMMIKTQDME